MSFLPPEIRPAWEKVRGKEVVSYEF